MNQLHRNKGLKTVGAVLLVSMLLLAAVYFLPISQTIDRTVEGIKGDTGSMSTQKISLQIKGNYHRYLLKPDTFEGYLRLEGYDYTFKNTMSPQFLTLNSESQQLRYNSRDYSKGVPLETHTLGMVCATANFDQVLILLLNGDSWNADHGDYACFPASTAEQAHKIFAAFAVV